MSHAVNRFIWILEWLIVNKQISILLVAGLLMLPLLAVFFSANFLTSLLMGMVRKGFIEQRRNSVLVEQSHKISRKNVQYECSNIRKKESKHKQRYRTFFMKGLKSS